MPRVRLLFGLLLLSLALPEAPLMAKRDPVSPDLEATLTAEPGASASGGVFLTLTVRNKGKTPRRFCDYHTPFEGMRNHFIEVRDEKDAEVPYRGMMAKRAPPTEEDFITVPPGQARAQRFDLRDGYQVRPGRYRVRFVGGSISQLPDSPFITLDVGP